MCTLRPGDGERTGTEFVGEHPVQVALAVAEPPCETAHAVALDDTVGDQSHRSGNDVLADVPFGRARRRIRPAPLAGAEAPLLGGGRRRVEFDVRALRGDRRAARTAVDARRTHGRDEPAVEPLVATLHSDVALVGIERRHVTIMPLRRLTS